MPPDGRRQRRSLVWVLDEDVACSVAVLFSRKPVARSNAFAAAMSARGGSLLDVSSKRMRVYQKLSAVLLSMVAFDSIFSGDFF